MGLREEGEERGRDGLSKGRKGRMGCLKGRSGDVMGKQGEEGRGRMICERKKGDGK